MTKTRIHLTCSLITCLGVATAWIAGCGNKSPTAPTVTGSSTIVTALTVKGNAALLAPGQTSQLSLEATLWDGSKKGVTPTGWFSSNTHVVTVSPDGLMTAVDFGKASVTGSAAGTSSPSFPVTVLPEGAYILTGHVTEAGNLSVADARVETIGGPMSGRVVMTDGSGNYAFNGVSGVAQVKATKDGYQPAILSVPATQSVTQDTEQVNIQMTPASPYASLAGIYRLTFRASPSCQLPDEDMSRTYTAQVTQTGPLVAVVLSDAQFGAYFNHTWNAFNGRVLGNTVSFTLNAGYDALYLGGVAEKLADNRYLMLAGTADGTVTGSTISTAFAGVVSVLSSPQNLWGASVLCTASDHQLIFTGSAATASRTRF
jgi:Bacterial Ig-like domain (group 2)